MGVIDKKLAAFLKARLVELAELKFGIFLCGCLYEKVSEAIVKNFSDDVLEKAACVEFFGGEMFPEKQRGLDKIVVNSLMKIAKSDPSFNVSGEINAEKISEFALEILK